MHFTARRYISAVYAVTLYPSVCPSVADRCCHVTRFKFRGPSHISGMVKAEVVEFRTKVSHIKLVMTNYTTTNVARVTLPKF